MNRMDRASPLCATPPTTNVTLIHIRGYDESVSTKSGRALIANFTKLSYFLHGFYNFWTFKIVRYKRTWVFVVKFSNK